MIFSATCPQTAPIIKCHFDQIHNIYNFLPWCQMESIVFKACWLHSHEYSQNSPSLWFPRDPRELYKFLFLLACSLDLNRSVTSTIFNHKSTSLSSHIIKSKSYLSPSQWIWMRRSSLFQWPWAGNGFTLCVTDHISSIIRRYLPGLYTGTDYQIVGMLGETYASTACLE